MKTRFHLENLDSIGATLTVTMSLGQWKKVMATLQSGQYKAESSQLIARIADIVAHAEQIFKKSLQLGAEEN